MKYNITTPLNSQDVKNINKLIDSLSNLDMVHTELHKSGNFVMLCFKAPVQLELPLLLDVRINTCILDESTKYITISL